MARKAEQKVSVEGFSKYIRHLFYHGVQEGDKLGYDTEGSINLSTVTIYLMALQTAMERPDLAVEILHVWDSWPVDKLAAASITEMEGMIKNGGK